MDYAVLEILMCLLAVGVIAGVIGWLLRGVFEKRESKTLEAAKDRHIGDLQGEIAIIGAAREESAIALNKLSGRLKDAEAKLAASAEQLTEAKKKHETEAGQLQQRVAALAPLTAAVAEREARVDVWRKRFEGLVQEKDKALAAGQAELAEHKSKLAALGLTLAAAATEKDSLHAQIAEHRNSIEAVRTQLQAVDSERDQSMADLRSKLEAAEQQHSVHAAKLYEMTTLLSQRDEQLKSFDQRMRGATAEKDTIIGKLRSMVSQIEPMRQELQLRDQAIEQMQRRMAMPPARPAGPSSELEEAQRQIYTMLAGSASMKAALDGKDAEIAALSAKAGHNPPEGKVPAALSEKEQALPALQATHEEVLRAKDERAAMLERQVLDITGRHAAAKAELDDWAVRAVEMESRLRRQTSEHEAAVGSVEAKQDELDKARAEVASLDRRTVTVLDRLKARVAELEKALDEEVPREAKLRETVVANQSEMTELRAEIARRDEQVAGVAMLQNQVVDLTVRHAGAMAKLDDLGARHADLEARLRQAASGHEAAVGSVDAKQAEIEKARAEVADLDRKLMAALSAAGDGARIASERVLSPQALSATPDDQTSAAQSGAESSQKDERIRMLENLESRLQQQGSEHRASTSGSEDRQDALDHSRAEVAVTALSAPGGQAPADRDERLAMLENQMVDVTGRHAAAQAELNDWAARFVELEARFRQQAAEHEAAARMLEAKQDELDKARAEVAHLDSKLMAVPALENELTELKAQIVDRDERLEAWDSRFHASTGELHGEIGTLNSRLLSQDEELHKLRSEVSVGPASALATAAGKTVNPPGNSIAAAGAKSAQRAEDARRLKEILETGLAMRGVQFLPSSAELIPQALPILEKAAEAMDRCPDVSVEIAGHTDSWGMPPDNLRLSQQRAGAVKEYLINSGIAAWRLIEIGYGDTRPIDSNETADGRFANRRIEFHVKQ